MSADGAVDQAPAARAVHPAEPADQPVAAADGRGVDGHPPRSLARARAAAARDARRPRRQLPRDARQRSAPRVVGRVGRSARVRAEDGGLLQAVQHRQERRRGARSDRRACSSPSWSDRGSACGAARSPPAGTSGIRKQWDQVEPMFGTHEAKYQLKKWVEDTEHRRGSSGSPRRSATARAARSSSRCPGDDRRGAGRRASTRRSSTSPARR